MTATATRARQTPLRQFAQLILPLLCGTLSAAPGDLLIDPEGGEIANGKVLSISFPSPMISPDRIGQADPTPPLLFSPEPLPFELVWRSQTEAALTVLGPVIPGAAYSIRIKPGARSLDGAPLEANIPEHEFHVPAFDVSCQASFQDDLTSSPMVLLTFTHAVDVRAITDKIFFLDATTRRRHPIDVVLGAERERPYYDEWEEADSTEPVLPPGVDESAKPFLKKRISVQTRSPIPPGREWKLLVEGVTEAATGKPLPFPRVFAVGSTAPLKVEWLGAFNFAGQPPHIAARFNRRIDPGTISSATVKVEPPVPGLRILPVPPRELRIEGDFDTAQRYKVSISKAVKASSGFGLQADSVWGATFKPRQSSIIFPSSEISQRSAIGLHFSFLQSNTGAGRWTLARIPHEKLPAVRARLREFTEEARDPATGFPIPNPHGPGIMDKPTELLTEYFSLLPIASGAFDATPDGTEMLREISWKPGLNDAPHGPHLLEVTAPGPDGKLRGNRSIVWFSDFAVAQKRTATELILRVSSMADGSPIADASVSAISDDGMSLASATTGRDGVATFNLSQVFPPRARTTTATRFLIRDAAGRATSVPAYPRGFNSGYSFGGGDLPGLVGFTTTDRPIYRPGEPLRAKGIVRDLSSGYRELPKNTTANVRILSGADVTVADFDAPISALGGWEIAWDVPPSAGLGYYRIESSIGDRPIFSSCYFQIEEIRKPLFSVEVAKAESEPGRDAITVRSAYFHGSPNAGALVRWTSEWFTNSDWDPEINHSDLYTEKAVRPAYSASASGEVRLDKDGTATISVAPPFTDKALRSRVYVNWSVEVVSAEGQTIAAGTAHPRQLVAAAPGISAIESTGDPRGIKVSLVAVDENDGKISGLPMKLDVFRLDAKSFKQQLAPMVFRYVNTESHTKIHSRDTLSGESFVIPVAEPGRYVVAARLAEDPAAPLVSDRTTITGHDFAHFPVQTEDQLDLEIERSQLRPGDTAVIKTNGPRGGIAWVTVENREVLDSRLLRIEGNAGRIEIPIKAAYAPNAVIAVHLISPGGETDLPTERFGNVRINVDRPDLTLHPLPKLDSEEYQPGDNVTGRVEVRCEGEPVPNAEVAVWAVDDAILQLGSWQLPRVLSHFLPTQPHSVSTFRALGDLVRSIQREDIFQKGFIIGDGGDSASGNVLVFRENFKPLAFWAGRLTSGPDGTAPFSFKAPDSLTAWRVISVAHTEAGQFGAASSTFAVNKKLMIEPAFPRFVRSGDLSELRAIVRQRHAPTANVRVTAQIAEGPIEILEADPKVVEAARDIGAVVRFPVRAAASTGIAKVRFIAESPGFFDAFEVALPVATPEVFARETETFILSANARFDAAASLPESWKGRAGNFTAAASSSPFFPKLAGLPALLDYPHGCMEQITSRLLGYALLGDLLDYLPDSPARRKGLESIFASSLDQIEKALLEDGTLPYWPGSTVSNPFVTTQAAWMIAELGRRSIPVPEKLNASLSHSLGEIAAGRITSDPETQSLALYASAIAGAGSDEMRSAADSLYLRRERFSTEARALLALALTALEHNATARDRLLEEIRGEIPATGFNPRNFSSLTRTEAVCIAARAIAGGKSWSERDVAKATKRLSGLMESGSDLSTQENLWTLFAFRALLGESKAAILPPDLFKPIPRNLSANKATVSWGPADFDTLSKITATRVKQPLTWVFSGEFALPPEAQERSDRGIRIERVSRNLTSVDRDGTVERPFKIGDEVMITYRLVTDRPLDYLALEDPLPATFETINPNIESVAAFHKLPESPDPILPLSHSELRDQVTRLYFDRVEKGPATFSILARVTSAGRAAWPGPTATPMYDARWSGRGARSLVYSVAE